MGNLTGLWGGKNRLSTRRGKIAAGITVAVILLGAARQPSAAIVLVLVSPLLWWSCWVVGGGLRNPWRNLVEGTPPSFFVGRAWQPSSERKQLREDANAGVCKDRGGILQRERLWFIATGTPPIRLDPFLHATTQEDEQLDAPQRVAEYLDRTCWLYQDVYYWTNHSEYGSKDIQALVFSRERQSQRQLEHAHALMAAATSPTARKRDPIPKEVKLAVWKHDEGKCVECGSDFDLQYDHIIPFSMGGANTVENLKLLCARCNQQKGASL